MALFFSKAVDRMKRAVIKFNGKKVDAKGLTLAFQDLITEMKDGVRGVQAEVMVDTWQRIVDSTPVDLGPAQANWQIGEFNDGKVLHQDVLNKNENGEYGPWPHENRVVSKPDTPDPDDFFKLDRIEIYNNIDYIDQLESGSSNQAGPGAMIADNIKEMEIQFESLLKSTGIFK